jgi:hypothetical protein
LGKTVGHLEKIQIKSLASVSRRLNALNMILEEGLSDTWKTMKIDRFSLSSIAPSHSALISNIRHSIWQNKTA